MNMRGISGKWNAMWHSSPSPKYGRTSAGHWFASASSMRSLVARVERAADLLQDVVRLRQVLADRAFALDQVGHGVEAQAVDAAVEPELHDLDHRLEHLRVVEVQIRLMMEEAVPVVRLGGVVPAPVRGLGVGEDDPHALVLPVGLAPDVEVAFGRSRRRAPRRLEPRMLVGGVVDDELGDDADVRGGAPPSTNRSKSCQRAVARMDVLVVGDVVSVVAQRRRIEGQQPERVDAEALQVVELLRQAGEVADAVVRAVEERADVRLVDDGVLVPERIVGSVVSCRVLHGVIVSGQRTSQLHVQDMRRRGSGSRRT